MIMLYIVGTQEVIRRRVYLRERMKLLASLLVLGLAQNEQEIGYIIWLASNFSTNNHFKSVNQPDIHSFLGGLSAEERQALQFLLSEPAAPARAPGNDIVV